MMEPARIGITGGPAAGKSHVLSILKEKYNNRWFVPETATLLGSIGIDMNHPMFETLVWDTQFNLESNLARYTEFEKPEAIIFDRTMLDVLAYIKSDEAAQRMRYIDRLYDKYDGIIFLNSTSDTEKFTNNPQRKESTIQEVSEQARKIFRIMLYHPNFHFIPTTDTIEEKAELTDAAIKRIIKTHTDSFYR